MSDQIYKNRDFIIYEDKLPDGKIKHRYGYVISYLGDNEYYIKLIKGTNIFKLTDKIKVFGDNLCCGGLYPI